MKKILALILASLLVFALASCGGDKKDPATDPVTDPVTDPAGNGDDYDASVVYSGLLDENGKYRLVATDYVDLSASAAYKGFVLPKDIHSVSDDKLALTLAGIFADFSDSSVHLDRPVQKGDKVNIDYVGTVDGVEFEGGSTGGAGTDVVIGITTYIDDFLDQLIGANPGDTVNVEVTFPEDYGVESLNGKDALFVTKINYIHTPPVVDDEFVKVQLKDYGCETADEFYNLISTSIVEMQIENYVFSALTTDFTVNSIPETIIDNQLDQMLDYYQAYASAYGMTLDAFISEALGTTLDALKAELAPDCTEMATRALVCQAIADSVNIIITDDDITEYFKQYQGTDDFSDFEEYYGKPYLKQIVLERKVVDYIIENAVKE